MMTLSIAQYTIAWICALQEELTAAVLSLDESFDEPDDLPNDDNQVYRFGKLGKHYVVIAVPASGVTGTGQVKVANTAGDMLRTFRNLRIALLVGIGGGTTVRSAEGEVRLGDIVVGIPDNKHNGLLQHDFGKHIQGQTYVDPKKSFNAPPSFICKTVTNLVTDRMIRNHEGRWLLYDDVETILEENYWLRDQGYERPSNCYDLLFPSNIEHKVLGEDCQKCCEEHIVKARRKERLRTVNYKVNNDVKEGAEHRSEPDLDPVVHTGLIATGSTVIRDAKMRDHYAEQYGVLCFEMEAAGLMNTLPCLVIRGISNYCDTHKNDRWNGYAALIAAVYAKRLIKKLRAQKVEAETKLSEQVAMLEAQMINLKGHFEGESNNFSQTVAYGRALPFKGEEHEILFG